VSPGYTRGRSVVALPAFATVVGERRLTHTAPLKTVRMGIGVDTSYASYVVLETPSSG